jgi:YidC/Oxa1 family membrane protein insertase
MSEEKGMIFAIVLSFLILFGFHYFTDVQQAKEIQQNVAATATAEYTNNINNKIDVPQKLPREEVLRQTSRIPIKSAKLCGSVNLTGAIVDDLSLVDYKETTDDNSPAVALLNPANTDRPYYVSIQWVNAKSDDPLELPNEKTKWCVVGEQNSTAITPETPLKLTWANPQGVVFERTISVDDRYMISSVDKIINSSEHDRKIAQHCEITRFASTTAGISSSVHEGGVGYFDDNLKELSFDKIKKAESLKGEISDGWVGFTDKYWLTSFVVKDMNPVRVTIANDGDLAKCTLDSAIITLKANSCVEYKNLIFSGAKVLGDLDNYSKTIGVKKFDLAVDFGWFYFLTKPLFFLLQFFYSLLGNLALTIVLLTIFSKAALYPFSKKSFASMAKMKEMQPKIEMLKKTYSNDKVKVNEELMKLYKREKLNPASGCLPLLVQAPIFFCLYKVFAISIEMRHTPLIFWIKDLAAPDPTSLFNLFGLLPWTPPPMLQIGVLPLIMGATMFLQQKLSQAPADQTQAKIMYIMPLAFLFMFSAFPSGLVLYWTVSNILSIIQQYFMTKPQKNVEQ